MMENGSFHSSPQGVLETDDYIKSIPLPFEMPKALDFSKAIKADQPQSSTIETLIGQNEDLMARLGVSLRRTNHLEEKLVFIERENATLHHRFETLRDQLMVFQEKDRLWGDRSSGLIEESTELKSTIRKLEQRYTDVVVQAQALQIQLARLERYKARMSKVTKIIQARAKQAGRLNALNVELSTQQAALVQSFETKISECKAEIDVLQTRLLDRNALAEELVQLENKMIFVERQHESYRLDVETRLEREEQSMRQKLMEEFAEARATVQKDLDQKVALEEQNAKLIEETKALRFELKMNMVELNTLAKTESDQREKLEETANETANLREQVETLQVLWQDKQRQMDKLEDKNSSLQKLNQQLSLNLNQARKEIALMKSEQEYDRQQAQEKLNMLREEIEMLKRS
jgi:chromosome segregation ATPase